MRRRIAPVLLFAAAATAVPAVAQAPTVVTVHEWGTFTSVAGADGQAEQWTPLGGQQDLPCFVERNALAIKLSTAGTVRMETPVLYFYAPRETELSVRVNFPRGQITEWYPHADVRSTAQTPSTVNGAIAWPAVGVLPGTAETYPTDAVASHYYAARHTAAAPLRVGPQSEKFLFYRGVGQFQPPLSAIARDDGGVAVRAQHGAPIGDVVFFENRRGAMAFRSRRVAASDAVLARPDLDDASGAPLAELKRILIGNGLYEPEAQAMVDTWKDSWFEEGARLLYVVPARDVDEILPLAISPKPSAVTRVFVGRIELVTPATIRDVTAAMAANDRGVLATYGRFLGPIAERAGLAIPANAWPVVASSACR
jgi:hypothetical protein